MDLFYRVEGSGPPIVWVHAGIADGRMWEPQVAAFARSNQLIVPDLRGFGRTPLPAGSFGHSEDLMALANHLGIERAVWVGCSMGGTVVLDLALAEPSLVGAMVLANCTPSGFPITDPVTRNGWARAGQAFDDGDLVGAATIEMEMWLVGPTRTADAVPNALRSLVTQMILDSYGHGEGEADDPAKAAIDHLGGVSVPTLVVSGEHDQSQFRSAGALLADGISDSRHVIIPAAGHLPSLERPEAFNAHVAEFLAEGRR